MRSIAGALTVAQAGGGFGAVAGNYKVVVNAVTYDESQIRNMLHTEGTDGDIAIIVIDNSDSSLDTLDVKGLQADISYGVDGDYTSGKCRPLWITAQRQSIYGGLKTVVLECEGIVDRLKRDEAAAEFLPEAADTTTVRTYLQHILSATAANDLPLWVAASTYSTADYRVPTTGNGYYYKCTVAGTSGASEPTWPLGMKATVADSAVTWQAWGKAATVYSHCDPVVLDTITGLPASYSPANGFQIPYRGSRWDAVKQLYSLVGQVPMPRNNPRFDSLEPTISGTTYDFVYDNAGGTAQTFSRKDNVQAISAPNYVTVASMPDDATQISATAANSADNALLDIRTFRQVYLASTALASSVATGIMNQSLWESDKGRLIAPMNVAQEVYDYVQVIDTNGSTITGNVTEIMRRCSPGNYHMELRIGGLSTRKALPAMAVRGIEPREPEFRDFYDWFNSVLMPRLNNHIEETNVNAVRLQDRIDNHVSNFAGAHGGGVPLVRSKTEDQTVVSSTVLVDDDVLQWPIAASVTYGFNLNIMANGPGTEDLRLGWSVPSGATMNWTFIGHGTGNEDVINPNLSETSTQLAGLLGATADVSYLVNGVVTAAGTAGTVGFRFAQVTAGTGGVKLLKGSYLTAHKLRI